MSVWTTRVVSKILCLSMLLYMLLPMFAPLGSVSYAEAATDAVFDFEDGTTMGWHQGWGDGFAVDNPVSASSDLSVSGNAYSLKVNTAYAPKPDNQWQEAVLVLDTSNALGEYEAVTYDVYVPAAFGDSFILSTALNGQWADLKFTETPIAYAQKTMINGVEYAVIHETAAIPENSTQKQLIIKLAKNSSMTYSGPIYMDNVVLKKRLPVVAPPDHSGSVRTITVGFQDAELNGPLIEKRTSPTEGDSLYAGNGYVSFFFEQPSGTTSTATFHLDVPEQGLYKLSVGYYIPTGYGSKITGLQVNGTGGGDITLDAPDEGTVVKEKLASKVMLNAGSNSVTFSRGWGYYGIEYIKIESANPPAASSKLEAEDGVMEGGVSIGVAGSGYSGQGYAAFQSSGSLTLTYNAAAAGMYDIAIGYGAPYGDKKTTMVVNGATTEISLAPTAANEYQEVSGGKALLQAGGNTITFTPNWGWYHIDYIKITAAAATNAHEAEAKLVNPNATAEARALMSYLVSKYGKNILSGQQNLEDSEWIYEQTGKYPAIFSSDLMDYSPSRVENGATSTEVEKMIQWFNKGGIVGLAWHWNAPKGLFGNEPGHEWWRGFYTEHTTFDVQYALEHPESEDYQLILRDIDAIAIQLKRLQDAHVPVLWRPLHEAEGGWFWWGAKGPEFTKQLYRLMYERLTNLHHLNNLIWIWNSEKPEWYPGDDVVDIASLDIYGPDGDYNPNIAKYDSLVSLVKDKKLVALAENGSIPDPDQLQAYHADWIFFSTWSGDFIRDGLQNSPEHLMKVYNSDYVLTRDELPVDLYGTVIFEAETGTMTGVSISTEDNGYSGTAFVSGFDAGDDKLVVPIDAAAGTYMITIRYRTLGGDKTNPVSINGTKFADYTFKNCSVWKDAVLGQFTLNSGINTIEIGSSWGYTDIDYIRITGGGGPVTHVTLQTEEGTSGPADVPVTLSAIANNTAEYQFYAKKSDGEWTALNSFSPHYSYTWLPAEPGLYEFKAIARKPGVAGSDALSSIIAYTVTPTYTGKPLVNPMFSSSMILQRDEEAELWGWNEPGAAVTVTIDGRPISAATDAGGQWKAGLGIYPAGGPHTITVTNGTQTVTFTDILFGDVYLASGQSNMAFAVKEAADAAEEIANASQPNIRFITIPEATSRYPLSMINSTSRWQTVTPDSVRDLSAVGYFFARTLTQETGVPFGIIFSAVGGTKAENWTSYESLQSIPSLARPAKDIRSGSAIVERSTSPTVLYNGMIAPVAPYKLKGVLWYQGESNWGEYRYNKALPTLISDWRETFKNQDLPFTIIQISTYGTLQSEANPAQADSNPGLPVIREAQLHTVLNDDNTTLVVTTDVGNPLDIHPTNKQDVGSRAAISVLGKFYGKEIVYSGPIYKSMTKEGSSITLSFDHTGSGLMAGTKAGLNPVQEDRSGNLSGFAIAGSNGTFYPAVARIEGNQIIVSSEHVSDPAAVRYNWCDSPIGNLYNKEGLPASPFRTDSVSYLSVVNGSGSGIYPVGQQVAISAVPAPTGMAFNRWLGEASIQNVHLSNTTLTMPNTAYTEVAPEYSPAAASPAPGTSTPSPTAPASEERKELKPDELQKDASGKVKVKLDSKQSQLVIPQAALKKVDQADLQVEIQGLTVTLPNQLLKSFMKTDKDTYKILFQVNAVVEPAKDYASPLPNGRISLVGKVYDFRISVETENGQSAVSSLAAPVTVRFPIPEGTDASVIGAYYIGDEGQLEYVGGKIVNGQLEAALPHFSSYGLMEYTVDFADVDTSFWAHQAIRRLASKHLIQGISDTEFAPGQPVTREHFTAVMAKALGLTPSESDAFADVSRHSEFAPYIAAAYEAGWINGVSETEFKPKASITRQEMAVILMRVVRYLGKPQASYEATPFDDQSHIAEWAAADVQDALGMGLLEGRDNHLFAPFEKVTRAEMAQLIARIVQ